MIKQKKSKLLLEWLELVIKVLKYIQIEALIYEEKKEIIFIKQNIFHLKNFKNILPNKVFFLDIKRKDELKKDE